MSEETEAPTTLLGRARRRLVGAARWVSAMAKGMALGGLAISGTLFVLTGPEGLPGALALAALGGIGMMMASPFVGALGMLLRLGGLRRDGEIHRDERGLFLTRPDGSVWVLGSHVASGVVAPSEGRVDVQLRFVDGNEVSIWVPDEATADALLDLVGVGPEQRRTRVRWASLPRRIAAGTLGAGVGFVAGLVALLSLPEPFAAPALFFWFMAPFLAAPLFAKWLAWRELDVGTDGIAWRYFGRRKVVPLHQVRRAEVSGDDLVVGLADGTDRRFTIRRRGLAEGLRRRIDAVLSAVGRGAGRQGLFARADLTFPQWVERMQVLLRRGSAHRDQPVHVDDVVAVLEDPQAEPEARVGAALALGRSDAPGVAARVRVVAETCVSPKLRVALEAAAAGELEEEVVEAARRDLRTARQK